MQYLRKNKGITLIALIVTIVVLIILATITIGTLTGDQGIIQQAAASKESAEIQEEIKMIDIAVVAAMNEDKYGEIKHDELKTQLDKVIKDEAGREYELSPSRDAEVYVITYTDTQRSYQVDQDAMIAKLDDTYIDEEEIIGEGNIIINIDVTSYNTTLGSYPVVFSVIGTDSVGDIVYDDIVSTTISESGLHTIELSMSLESEITVEVTEIYSGANYTIDTEMAVSETVLPDETTEYSFTNTCDYYSDIKNVSSDSSWSKTLTGEWEVTQ